MLASVLVFFGALGVEGDLEADITSAVLPILTNYSLLSSMEHNRSGWAFAYRDADISFELAVGDCDSTTQARCTTRSNFAWGSTTKVQTSIQILQLVDRGELGLDDLFVDRADAFTRKISNGAIDLESLFGPLVRKITLRQLLGMRSGLQEYDNPSVRRYQNIHRSEDLSPIWILQNANRSFLCEPGTCGKYSSLGYVLLGLVLGQATNASSWDSVDQTAWQRNAPKPSPAGTFDNMRYGVHGPLSGFIDAEGRPGRCVSGYQRLCHHGKGLRRTGRPCVAKNESDVRNMSATQVASIFDPLLGVSPLFVGGAASELRVVAQGWTCGNLVTSADQTARFFFELLGARTLLSPAMLKEQQKFVTCDYLGKGSGGPCGDNLPDQFGYGLGLMNFTSMDWGFEHEGEYYGHNGLTYGFGSQSGYNYPLAFSASWGSSFVFL